MPTPKEELLRRGLKPHDIQHNQHRRAEWQNYGGCGLYMITLCIDGRHPFFGYLEGNIRATRGTTDFPHLVLSTLGRTILENELPKIHSLYPQIEIWQVAIMPDHLHLLIYVSNPLPGGKKLGDIIRLFKGGCSRAWWAQGTNATTVGNEAGVPVLSSTVQRPSLFESGYHDRIIRRPGMLDTIKRYMNDNPLRALMRRQLPNLMERRLHLRVGTHEYAAFGALFLLKRAEKEQVFYHRRDKDTGIPTEQTESYKRERERQLAEARTGVVLVSPGISKGESLVIDAAIEEGLPVIHLQKKPIERYWKPERRRFEACARGALLILAPWGLDEEIMRTALESTGTPSDYARFHRLNDLAEEICNTTDVTLLNMTGIA
jgi:REP element-mobilizing transposase RayT